MSETPTPDQPQQQATPRLVTATVNRYFANSGYGFAHINGEQTSDGQPVTVYFHRDRCRVVLGTADGPELTRKPNQEVVSGYDRNPTQLLMLVGPNNRGGLKAIAWGSLPQARG